MTIVNPYNLQDFESDKLSILDVKAVDESGSIYHIEMQLTTFSGLTERIVFYGCELYAGQLKAGEDYTQLKPVYSVCLIDGILFRDATNLHHRFQLSDPATGRVLHDILEIHILELARYTLTETQLATASQLYRWLYWLLNAQRYEPDALLRLFPEAEIQQATRALIEISEKTEDKTMYDAREKAIRDQQSALNSARQEGERIGQLMGKIATLEGILNRAMTDDAVLRGMSIDELTTLASELQHAARGRSSS